MRKIVPCAAHEVAAAIIVILNSPESEGEPGGESISVNELMELLKKDFELPFSELHIVLSQLSIKGEIGISLRTEVSNDSLPYAVADRIYYLNPPKEKEETVNASNAADLVRLIKIEINRSRVRGPIIARINLWDGRIVTGLYYEGKKKPDIATDFTSISESILLKCVEEKLLQNESFITRTGTGDDIIVIEWIISEE